MAKNVKKLLPEIKTPVLILQSLQDPTADPDGAEYILENIGSEDRNIRWFYEGMHVIVRDPEIKGQVFDETYKFISKEKK